MSDLSTKKTVCCLMGPTALGKTELAMRLHDVGPFEVISVDSAMVYRDMDIGSAKPDAKELERCPHRLIDLRDPLDNYNAGEFRRDALAEIERAHEMGRIPLLVGGTMLYFKVLLDGVADMPEADLTIRAELEARADREGWPALHAELAVVDPIAAERLHPNHSQRISRALEVYISSGRPLSDWHAQQQLTSLSSRYDVRQVALWPSERSFLHRRIEARFSAMLEQGFLKEVEALRARGDLAIDMPSMRSVGYRQAWEYLDGSVTYEEMIDKGVAATRQLAKRQLTWLRKWQGNHVVTVTETPDWSILTSDILDYFLYR